VSRAAIDKRVRRSTFVTWLDVSPPASNSALRAARRAGCFPRGPPQFGGERSVLPRAWPAPRL
jgi:hypothetical protein